MKSNHAEVISFHFLGERQAQCQTRKLRPVFMDGLLGQTPPCSYRNRKQEVGALKEALGRSGCSSNSRVLGHCAKITLRPRKKKEILSLRIISLWHFEMCRRGRRPECLRGRFNRVKRSNRSPALFRARCFRMDTTDLLFHRANLYSVRPSSVYPRNSESSPISPALTTQQAVTRCS